MAGNSGGQDKPAFELYYSFASQDEALCLELETHLKPLERHNGVKGWHRGKVPVGANEDQEIESHRERANGILLLLSPDYIADDKCYDEMQWAIERKQTDGLLVVPIILRPLEVEDIPFKTAHLLPTRGRPVTTWPSRDEAFQDILLGMRRLLDQHAPQQPQTSGTPIWNIPFNRNPLFTGREQLLQQLHTNLHSHKVATLTQSYQQPSQQPPGQPQAISGLGGIGKTQTAVEYAYRHRDEYHYILWVNADTRDTIITSFLQLATLLRLPERDAQDQNIMIAAVKHWFTTHDGWLAIFDNADDLPIIEDFLPPGDRGHLLITTRAHAPGTLANSLEVEKLDLPEAMLLLLRRAKVLPSNGTLDQASLTNRATAEAIARELDGLPLALDQAGAYIEETQCSLTSYLNQYRKRQATLLKRRGGTGKQHPEPVGTTWSLSFDQVEKLNTVAPDLLRFLSFLASDAVPEQLIIKGASKLGPTLQPLADDESLLDEAIAALARYSLVKRKREDSTLTVHRLVQTIVRNSLDEQTQRQWAEQIIHAVNKTFPDATDYRNWPLCQQFLPHTQNCAVLIDQWQFAFDEAGRLCNEAGLYLNYRAQFSEAETFYRRAITIGEQTLGPTHPYLAIYLNNLATLYRDLEKYEQAEPLYQRAIEIEEKTLGLEHPNLAREINNLALLYTDQGKYQDAESLFRRAIAIVEKALGPGHSGLIAKLNNLALLYSNQGKYEQAEPLYQRAILISEDTLGPEDPNLATMLNNLAMLYVDQGKYEQAEPLFQRAIAINEKVLGPAHHNTILYRKNYAEMLRRWKKGEGE